MPSKERKFRRRVRARMEKTGESYEAAHRNLNKSRTPKAADQQPKQSLPRHGEGFSSPRFSIHVKLAALSRTQPAIPTPEEQAARTARLWERLKRELSRLASPRATPKLLEAVKKKGLDDEKLERLVLAFATLPTGFMRQLELIAEQIRQLQPIFEEAASLGDLGRQAAEMRNLVASLQPTAAMDALREFAARKIPDEFVAAGIPEILASVPRLLDEAGAQYINEGPLAAAGLETYAEAVAAAIRSFEDDAVIAALRYSDNNAVAAAMRLFEDSPLAAATRMLYRDTASAALIS